MRNSWKCISWGQGLHFGYSPFSENKAQNIQNIKKKKKKGNYCCCAPPLLALLQVLVHATGRDLSRFPRLLLRILVELFARPTKAAFTENDGSEQAPRLVCQAGQVGFALLWPQQPPLPSFQCTALTRDV